MPLPPWLKNLRRELITTTLRGDARTIVGRDLLGVPQSRIFNEVIGGGQADFNEPWEHLSPDDRVLLYAHYNQPKHLAELAHAFKQMAAAGEMDDPVVVDLGCGPFTGGLALGSVLGADKPFTYVGVDRAHAMHRLGDRLATGAIECGGMSIVLRHWVTDLDELAWLDPPRWRPAIVIVSYLLASSTLDVKVLVAQLERFLERLGFGPVAIIYTNSQRPAANRNFPEFRRALEAVGFEIKVEDVGTVPVEHWDGTREHQLQYAICFRQPKTILRL